MRFIRVDEKMDWESMDRIREVNRKVREIDWE